MIRPFTLIALIAAGGAGLNLYSVKREAQLEEQTTVKILREAKEVRTHAGLLHAEYDLLSDPDRLQELANQVLKLQPTDPKQYVSLADLTKRLPAVAPLPAPPEPPKVEPPKVEPPKIETPAPDLVAEKPVEKPAEKIADKAEPKPVAEKLVQVVSTPKPAPTAAPQPPAQMAAVTQPAPKPVVVVKPAVVAETRPLPSVPTATPVQARQPALRPLPAVSEAPAAAPAPAPYAGSALGMARMRAKFVPSDSGADR